MLVFFLDGMLGAPIILALMYLCLGLLSLRRLMWLESAVKAEMNTKKLFVMTCFLVATLRFLSFSSIALINADGLYAGAGLDEDTPTGTPGSGSGSTSGGSSSGRGGAESDSGLQRLFDKANVVLFDLVSRLNTFSRCDCTCTHAHMHTCTHAHMHTCTHAHMHTYKHAHIHTYYKHAHIHTYTLAFLSVFIYTLLEPCRLRSRAVAPSCLPVTKYHPPKYPPVLPPVPLSLLLFSPQPDFCCLSAYLLLLVLWAAAFLKSRSHWLSSAAFRRVWLWAYLCFNAALYR